MLIPPPPRTQHFPREQFLGTFEEVVFAITIDDQNKLRVCGFHNGPQTPSLDDLSGKEIHESSQEEVGCRCPSSSASVSPNNPANMAMAWGLVTGFDAINLSVPSRH